MVNEGAGWCIDTRRYLHMHPELSFREFETTRYIKKQLEEIGITDISPVGDTGLVCSVQGERQGKTIMLRADIDALPIHEESSAVYRSRNDNTMHACGHDAHTAMMLLAARTLNAMREDLRGTVSILFQPAEETIPGGALGVIEHGFVDRYKPSAIIGQHVMPGLACGKIGIRPGKFMASSDEFFITVRGKGGHAAMPEHLVDPVVIAGHVIVALQQVVSRKSNPRIPSVLSVGKVIAPGATNVIPDEVVLEGTFRTMDEEWRAVALKEIENLVHELTVAMGGTCKIQIKHGYPHLKNDESLTERARKAIADYVGQENVEDEDIWMAAEDFAYYGKHAPALFYLLGSGSISKGITSGLHTSGFDIDEECLPVGAGLMTWLAVRELEG